MNQLPDDRALTDRGLDVPVTATADQVLLIACGALAREIIAVRDANGWDHLAITCLPAKLHNDPQHIPQAVRARVRQARADGFESIFVVYADCGTGGLLDNVCAEEGVERIAGPHCYSFFDGNDAFVARTDTGEEMTAFYLTDFLARQFDTLIWKGMGLDRHPDLLPMIFGNYEKLIYLAQTEDQVLEDRARAAADKLGLVYERRQTGYGDLTTFLQRAAT
ncbi:MAG: DUF1638 domain-containing protein [Pseudomonadota bacterium]